jgi:ABC-2 type transport system ATP-binding protein
MSNPAIEIDRLSHSYGQRRALEEVSLTIQPGEIFGFLGPNGSGKTTLFRILATLMPPQAGHVRIFISDPEQGWDLLADRDRIRRHIGVVFQSPSLDKELTAAENLRHHGHLYGLRGAALEERIDQMLHRLDLDSRPDERIGRFSGGMRRRVELAKGLLNRPRILLLDEPSTGLDPGARIDLWRYLHDIQQADGTTILLTTHLMDEAEHCHRLAIMDQGRLVVIGMPAALKERIGGDIITLTTAQPQVLRQSLQQRFGISADEVNRTLRIERPRGHQFIPELIEAFPGLIDSVSLGKPTLQDVFIHVTGHGLSSGEEEPARI